MENKICPMMLQGMFSNGHLDVEILRMRIKDNKKLPQCLKEKCALWVEATYPDSESENKFGYCGLINQRVRTNWSPV